MLPRVPDQTVYYSRQFYWYNFTICKGYSKSIQTKDTVTAYIWTENIRDKGSNEIVSMLMLVNISIMLVNHKLFTLNLAETVRIKLFCDGCPGSNKNPIMIGILMHWLCFKESSVQGIHVIFPIVGHSFLPPDSVFERTEKKVKKEVIQIQGNTEKYCLIAQPCLILKKIMISSTGKKLLRTGLTTQSMAFPVLIRQASIYKEAMPTIRKKYCC